MKGDALNPDHCIVAYASSTKIDNGSVDGEVFMRRASDTDGLSVNWVECFPAPRPNQITEICRRVRTRMTIRNSGRFAEIKVDAAATAVVDLVDTFGAIEDPLEADGTELADESHSLFMGLPEHGHEKAQAVGDAIAATLINLHEPVLE